MLCMVKHMKYLEPLLYDLYSTMVIVYTKSIACDYFNVPSLMCTFSMCPIIHNYNVSKEKNCCKVKCYCKVDFIQIIYTLLYRLQNDQYVDHVYYFS